MKLLTKENMKKLPALYSQDGKGLEAVAPEIHVHAVGQFQVHAVHRHLVDVQEHVLDIGDAAAGRIAGDLRAQVLRATPSCAQRTPSCAAGPLFIALVHEEGSPFGKIDW